MMSTPNATHTTPRTFLSIWNGLSLRAKLVIILLMVALIPLIIIVFMNYRNARQSALNDANARLLGSAASIADQLDEFIQAGLDTARYQAHLPVTLDYMSLPSNERQDSREEENLLDFMLTASYEDPVYITSIAVLDIEGTTLIDTSAAEVGVSNAERVHFLKVLETGLPYASSVEYDHITGKPSLYFSAPIQNAKDELIGVLRIRYDALILQDLIAQNNERAGKNSFAMLLDENHIRLAHGTERESLHKSIIPLDENLAAQLQSQWLLPLGDPKDMATDLNELEAGLRNFAKQPAFTAPMQDGEPSQVALSKMKTENWLVVFTQPQADILAPVNAQARMNIFIAVLIAIGVAFLGLIIAEALADSIIRLTNPRYLLTSSESMKEENAVGIAIAPIVQIKKIEADSLPLSPSAVMVESRQDSFERFTEAGTNTQTALATQSQITAAVTMEQSQATPSSGSRLAQQQTGISEDKLEVAIRRLGDILGAARVNADPKK